MTTQNSILQFQGEYRWLSNFWPASVEYDGEVYSSVECAYQAAKTLDLEKRKLIQAQTAGMAKKIGKGLIVRKDWNEIKIGVMLALLRQKFLNDPKLGERLLATGDRELIEGNWWGDTFWGVCRGFGENRLGKLIMSVREELKQKKG
jgi:ribA/ribD-fused uncharacterized protein